MINEKQVVSTGKGKEKARELEETEILNGNKKHVVQAQGSRDDSDSE